MRMLVRLVAALLIAVSSSVAAEQRGPTSSVPQDPLPVRIVEMPAPHASATPSREDPKADELSVQDLSAQVRTAEAAELQAAHAKEQVELGWVALVLSAFGAVLLAWTLHETRRSASAAVKAAEISEQALVTSQRAYVAPKGIETQISVWTDERTQAPYLKEYVFVVPWENSGVTPAMDVRVWILAKEVPYQPEDATPPHFEKTPQGVSTVLSGGRSPGHSSLVTVSRDALQRGFRQESTNYVWARVEYRDVFHPERTHHHEVCVRLNYFRDPGEIPPKGHPPYVHLGLAGPQNTAS